jgi:UDP-N-acetylglucosamine 2-epimerase (non-hydrolysing)
MAPIVAEMRKHHNVRPILIHTGQHYDANMSEVFLDQLGLGKPDFDLQAGSGSHHAQTAKIISSFGDLVQENRPDMVVVVGDVNSTMACALVAAKECIPLAHVEAGLRSFDRTMPEEINRIVTDGLADILFTTEQSGCENLIHEGIPSSKAFFVGNVMIDSLLSVIEKARQLPLLREMGLRRHKYIVMTMHRPANVDGPLLSEVIGSVSALAQKMPVIFPAHPRTAERIRQLRVTSMNECDPGENIGNVGIWLIPPASYLDFLCLIDSSAVVITDSGGIQEETTFLGVPCLTLRDNTERPITIQSGTNRLLGSCPKELMMEFANALLSERDGQHFVPPLWDGRSSERIVKVLRQYLEQRESCYD